MTDVILPRLSQTGANEWADVEANDVALREVINGELDNSNLSGSAGITAANLAGEIPRAKLASDAKPVTWYTPKVIATEQSRESASFGTMTTADEIKEVVLPENGLIVIGYTALVKASVSLAGRAAVFIGSNQLKLNGVVTEALCDSGTFKRTTTNGSSLYNLSNTIAFATTGEVLSPSSEGNAGGPLYVWAAAGTYNISVQFKASSGTITVKERKLWVWTLGV
jgi:hypothetical protein